LANAAQTWSDNLPLYSPFVKQTIEQSFQNLCVCPDFQQFLRFLDTSSAEILLSSAIFLVIPVAVSALSPLPIGLPRFSFVAAEFTNWLTTLSGTVP